jgi:mannose/cellobiose epimerase-like protein (N-acyl-D-glucosamine 2-epimerase family)
VTLMCNNPDAAARPRAGRAPALVAALTMLVLALAGSERASAATASAGADPSSKLAEQAKAWQLQLSEHVMPYWYDTTIDRQHGGYLLAEQGVARRKQLATQAQMVRGFAHAYRKGIRDQQRDYLAAAAQGYRYLIANFRDPTNGGYFWVTDVAGQVLDDRKFLYGQAYVLAALVEYYRASRDREALRAAAELYRTIQDRCHDAVSGGWGEHFERDWSPVTAAETAQANPTPGADPLATQLLLERARQAASLAGDQNLPMAEPGGAQGDLGLGDTGQGDLGSGDLGQGDMALGGAGQSGPGPGGAPPAPGQVPVGILGTKSADALLAWMEALTELLLVTREANDPTVETSGLEAALEEALRLNLTYFFPARPGQSYAYRYPDWRRPLGPSFTQISYGRNVEFAWQMVAAQRALGQEPTWDRFDAILKHALAHGYDHEHGGLYYLGFDDRPALATDKLWWVQAEMLAALTEGLKRGPNPNYAAALDQLLSFLTTYQIDPTDGIWFDTVRADGSSWRPYKAHNRKANYHELRAVVKFIEAFGPGS